MNLGGTYERQKNWDKALEYYNESLTVSGNDGNMNDFTKCLSNIGYVYYARAEFNNAKPYLFKSINIADKIRNREILQTDYEILSDIFLNEKQFEKAYQYQSLFTKLKDSISKETNLKRLQELEGKYEAGKKQKEIELLNKEKEKQLLLSQEETKRKNEIILSIFIGLLITLVFSLLLFNRFRIIKKQKIIIEEKNKDITDSIRYAKRIQQSQLPTEKYITKNLDRLK
jgi:tetratricopeptide (TPR) repeat protein